MAKRYYLQDSETGEVKSFSNWSDFTRYANIMKKYGGNAKQIDEAVYKQSAYYQKRVEAKQTAEDKRVVEYVKSLQAPSPEAQAQIQQYQQEVSKEIISKYNDNRMQELLKDQQKKLEDARTGYTYKQITQRNVYTPEVIQAKYEQTHPTPVMALQVTERAMAQPTPEWKRTSQLDPETKKQIYGNIIPKGESPSYQESQFNKRMETVEYEQRINPLSPVVLAGAYTIEGAVRPLFHPFKTVGGVVKLTGAGATPFLPISQKYLYKTANEQTKEFSNNPMRFTFNTLGTLALFKGVTKIPIKPTVEVFEIPTQQTAIKVTAVGLKTPKGRSLVGGTIIKTPEVIEFGLGTPNIKTQLTMLSETGEIKLGTPLQTKIIIKNLVTLEPELTSVRAKELTPVAQSILRKTETTKSKFIDEKELTTPTERLPTQGVKVVLDIAKEEQGILFGSKSRAFQLAKEYDYSGTKFTLDKVPRDIELRFDYADNVKLQSITDNTITRLKNVGKIKEGGKIFDLTTTREIKDTPFAIESKVNGKFEKVIEFKGKDSIMEEQVPEYVVGVKKVGKPMKIQGTQSTMLSEELRGVTQGVMRVRKSKETGLIDIFPAEKRMKDIGSVSVSARTLEMSKSKLNPFKRVLKKDIEKFESMFPEELVKEQVKASLNEKSMLADFRKTTTEPSLTKLSITEINPKWNSISESIKEKKYPSISPVGSPYKVSSLSTVSSPFKSLSASPSKSGSPSLSSSPSYSPSSFSSLSPSPSPSPPPPSPSPSPSPSPPPPSPSPSPSPSPPPPSPSPSPSPSPPPPSPSPNPKPSPFFPFVSSSPSPKVKGYNVYMKEYKKVVKANEKPLPYEEAVRLGQDVADNSLSASYKISDAKTNVPKATRSKLATNNFNPNNFVKSARHTGWFVEKRNKRLDTRGEKKGITASRLLSQRRKEMLKTKTIKWGF